MPPSARIYKTLKNARTRTTLGKVIPNKATTDLVDEDNGGAARAAGEEAWLSVRDINGTSSLSYLGYFSLPHVRPTNLHPMFIRRWLVTFGSNHHM